MSKSIMSNERRCWRCGTTLSLHKHHIFYGWANRKLSDKYGCWCYLCERCHDMSDHGVHSDKEADLSLKRQCQKKLEEEYGWTKDKMIEVFGRNWL